MNILGFSANYHDSAACLLQDGQVTAAAQEERFSRVKHDPSFPAHAIEACLAHANLTIGDLDIVVFYEKPLLKFDRILESFLYSACKAAGPFVHSMPNWLTGRLWVEGEFRDRLGYDNSFLFTGHHQAHAASAFYPSPYP